VASNRQQQGRRLYTHVARELKTATEGWQAWVAEAWFVVLLIALGALLALLVWCVGWGRRTRRGAVATWLLSYAWMALVIGWLGLTLFVLAHPEEWRSHTDGGALTVRDGDRSLRKVIWERPLLLDTQANRRPSVLAVASTPRGRMVVFSRQWLTEDNADLYVMFSNGAAWSDPVALDAVNSDADEKSPALSKDGKVLLFQSNRPGGLGGSDLYVAWWDGEKWTAPRNLGSSVNSKFDECDPGLSADERTLYFASDRGGKGGDLDIYRADGVDLQPPAAATQPTQPAPSRAVSRERTDPVRVDALSSPSIDRSPTFTRHGDFVYFSSDRPGGLGGMDVYRARVVGGAIGRCDSAGPLVNSPEDDLAPAPACHGFELLVTSDRVFNQRRPLLLYSQVSWEVTPAVDWAALQWIERAKWWLLALLLGLLLLAGVLVWYFKRGQYGRLGRLAKCVMLSMILHAGLLVLLSLWMIGQAIRERGTGPMEVAVDANALASERLAQDIRECVTEMPNTRDMVYIPSDVPAQDLPDYEPVNPTARRIVESDFVIERVDVPTDVKRVEIAEQIQLPKPKPVVRQRPSLRFEPTDLELEEAPREAKEARKAAEPVEVGIAPVQTTEQLSTSAEAVRPASGGPERISRERARSSRRSSRPTPATSAPASVLASTTSTSGRWPRPSNISEPCTKAIPRTPIRRTSTPRPSLPSAAATPERRCSRRSLPSTAVSSPRSTAWRFSTSGRASGRRPRRCSIASGSSVRPS